MKAMSQRSRQEYLKRIWPRYQGGGRKHRQLILNEFCTNCEYDRKYAIKLLNRPLGGRQRPPGPEATYGEAELEVLAYLWRQTDYLCSKRLKAALPIWLPHYERHQGPLSPAVRERLAQVSPATIDRLLAPVRAKASPHGRCGTRPGTLLRTQIPIRAEEWNVNEPGYLEADTVAHCGGSLAGSFVWSITYTDIWSGWTESRAIWNKGFEGVLTQTRELEAILPFPILAFDCDNGGEFLNYHLVRYFQKRKRPVTFTRSRPYHKDDNAHVEQKNWMHVRQLFGYDRFENPELVKLMNDLYRQEWFWFRNFFCPSMKLIHKERIKSRWVKKYDEPATPYQRLLQWQGLNAEKRQALEKLYQQLDPIAVKAAIERKLKRIFTLVHPQRLKAVS